jgi:hypothetical protein
MSKQLHKSIILLLLFALAAPAQDRVSLANGKVSFATPEGFRSLTESEI